MLSCTTEAGTVIFEKDHILVFRAGDFLHPVKHVITPDTKIQFVLSARLSIYSSEIEKLDYQHRLVISKSEPLLQNDELVYGLDRPYTVLSENGEMLYFYESVIWDAHHEFHIIDPTAKVEVWDKAKWINHTGLRNWTTKYRVEFGSHCADLWEYDVPSEYKALKQSFDEMFAVEESEPPSCIALNSYRRRLIDYSWFILMLVYRLDVVDPRTVSLLSLSNAHIRDEIAQRVVSRGRDRYAGEINRYPSYAEFKEFIYEQYPSILLANYYREWEDYWIPSDEYTQDDDVTQEEPKKGIRKDDGKSRMDLIPMDALVAVGDVLRDGAKKYAEHNWELGMDWSRCQASLMRHLAAWSTGEDHDPESGHLHTAHVVCNALYLLAYQLRNTGNDNRFKLPQEKGGKDETS